MLPPAARAFATAVPALAVLIELVLLWHGGLELRSLLPLVVIAPALVVGDLATYRTRRGALYRPSDPFILTAAMLLPPVALVLPALMSMLSRAPRAHRW